MNSMYVKETVAGLYKYTEIIPWDTFKEAINKVLEDMPPEPNAEVTILEVDSNNTKSPKVVATNEYLRTLKK